MLYCPLSLPFPLANALTPVGVAIFVLLLRSLGHLPVYVKSPLLYEVRVLQFFFFYHIVDRMSLGCFPPTTTF